MDGEAATRAVIRSYLAIAGLYTLSASLIWGVNTLFLLDAGLSLFQVFVANAAFTAGMVAFEIPTGVVADTRGRRVSFLLSVAVLCTTSLAYVGLAQIGAGIVAFSAVSVLLGLGFTFYSGAVEAWLVDALAAAGFTGQLDDVFSRGAQVSGAGMLVGTVGGGLLGQLDLALPFLVRSALLAGLFVLAWRFMFDQGFTPRPFVVRELPQEMASVARISIRFGWRQRSVRLLMAMGVFQMTFLAWGWYAWQPYFLILLGRDAVWVAGVVAAAISLATIMGNRLVAVLATRFHHRTTLLIGAGAVFSAAMVGVGFANSFAAAVGAILIGMVAMGVMGPVRQAYLHQLIPSEQRATVISFDGMMGSGGAIVGQLGLGRLAEARSLAAGYVLGGAFAAGAAVAAGVLRWRRDEEDVMVPTGPGA